MADQVAISHDVTQLVDKIKDIKVASLTTVDAHGKLHSRPMYTTQADDDGTLWFFCEKDSEKVQEICRIPEVNLGYNSDDQSTYVAITGQAAVVDDRPRIKDLWSEGLRGFFPQGSDDPNLTLLRVEIDNGEFWDVPSNALLRAYAYAKAVATGERHQPSPNEQAKVQV